MENEKTTKIPLTEQEYLSKLAYQLDYLAYDLEHDPLWFNNPNCNKNIELLRDFVTKYHPKTKFWRENMKKKVGDWSTEVEMDDEEAKNVCNLGKGAKCCAFLVLGSKGFRCIRVSSPMNSSIFARLEDGTMVAKGTGGWKGCAWEGII